MLRTMQRPTLESGGPSTSGYLGVENGSPSVSFLGQRALGSAL